MTSSIAQTSLSLLIVLGLLAGLAWVLKRVQHKHLGGTDKLIKVRSQVMVGPKERVVLLEVGDQWILTGVTATHVQSLGVFPKPDETP